MVWLLRSGILAGLRCMLPAMGSCTLIRVGLPMTCGRMLLLLDPLMEGVVGCR